MNRQRGTSWQQRARDWASEITVETIAGIIATVVIAALFSTGGYLGSQAVVWVKDPLHQAILGLVGVIGMTAVWVWRRRHRVSQPELELSELEAPWQARISTLWVLCIAGLHEEKAQQALGGQAWTSAWESLEEATRELLDHFYPDTEAALLHTIEGLKKREAVKDEEWEEIHHSLDSVVRDITPKTSAVCQVQPPFGSEIANSLQRVLVGMEETYQQAIQLRRSRAHWKAFELFRAIPGYRDANAQAARSAGTALVGPAIAMALIVIMAVIMIRRDIIWERWDNWRPQTSPSVAVIASTATVTPFTPTATATPTATPVPITFTITCADNRTYEVQAGESISISIHSAVYIEPSLAPTDRHAAKPERLGELPSEEGKFSYAPTDSEPDIVTFSFVINEDTGEATAKSLPITVVPPGGGLCD